MKIKCAYHLCKKEVEEEEVVKSTLLYSNGRNTAKEEREYCSNRCAEYDRMAHEP